MIENRNKIQFNHFLQIFNPVKYHLPSLLYYYKVTLFAITVHKCRFSSFQVHFAQFIIVFRVFQLIVFYLFDFSRNTRLLYFDLNYLNGFPPQNRIVFGAVLFLGCYFLQLLYFRFESVNLLKLVHSIVLEHDKNNYLLSSTKNSQFAVCQKITQKIVYIVYIFQAFICTGGNDFLLKLN